MLPHKDERSLGELLSELSRETGVLVRKELELAVAETTVKARKAASDAGMLAAGGVLAHAGFLVVLAALVIGLAQLGVSPWLAAALVGVAALGIGYALVTTGLSRLRQLDVRPTRTIDTLKENVRWTTRQSA